MRKTIAIAVLRASLAFTAFAAAPPSRVPAGWLQLIEQLGSEDFDTRKSAEKKLSALGEDVLPELRKVGRTHEDADVRLRALVIAAAIAGKNELEERTFTGHADGVNILVVSPDGKHMASASARRGGEHEPRVWEVATGKELLQLKGHKASVMGLAWSADGKRIVTGAADGSMILWDARTGKPLKTIAAHAGLVYYVALTPDGKKVVTCGDEKTVRVWDLATGKQSASNADNGREVRGVSVSPDGTLFATTGYDLSVRLIDVATGKQVRKMESAHVEPPWFSLFSPDGKLLATVAHDAAVRLFDVATGKQVRTFEGHRGGVPGLAFSPDGKRLMTGGHDRTTRIWEVSTGKELRKLEGHGDIVTGAAFLPDGRYAVTSSYDKTLRLWDVRR